MEIKSYFDMICFNLMSGLKEEDPETIDNLNEGWYPWYEMEAFHRYGITEFPKEWYDFLDKSNYENNEELAKLMDEFAVAGYKLYNKIKEING